MIQLDSGTVVVFDLDDTLYKENDYHNSGLRAVSDLLERLYGFQVHHKLCTWKANGIKDLWGQLCNEFDLPSSVKESLIWKYRLHSPTISLRKSALLVLEEFKKKNMGIVILTDGRSITQRLKLDALNLMGHPVYISEEWESDKLSPKRHNALMAKYAARQYVYVGDNPSKDFKVPNNLGWTTIGVKGDSNNIHSQNLQELEDDYLPSIWIDDLKEICELIC